MLTISTPTFDYSALQRANISESTRKKYISAIQQLISSGVDPFDRESLTNYVFTLPNSTKAFTKAGLAIMAKEYELKIKSNAAPENIATAQAMLFRLEAMTKTINVTVSKGEKAHVWLAPAQVEQITALPDRSTIKGMRDYIVLSVMLGAGLRRDELVNLTFDQIKQQPIKDGFRTVLSITGKGNKDRIIPINNKLAAYLRQWQTICGTGFVARSISKSGTIGTDLSEIGIHNIVRQYGALIGIPELDSHDLRRTYAQIGYNAGVPITQVSRLLGHADIRTTQRYLNLDIDLEQTASDFIPLSGD